MKALIWHPITAIWLLLMAATGFSYWLGGGQHAITESAIRQTTIAILVIAFIKLRFVVRYFMEVRTAPSVLKLLTDTYVVLACGAVILTYVLA